MSFFAYNAASLPGRTAPALILVLLVVSGCSTTAPRPYGVPSPAHNTPPPPETRPSLERQLRQASSNWLGTPHRWGGTGRNGIDCSAFVQRIYKDALGLSLPRTTKDQVRVGLSVDRRQIQIGDLIFFRHDRNKRHVGIYLGNDEFVHASSSRGVMVSKLHEPYWRRVYWTTRRVLDPTDAPPVSTSYTPADSDAGPDRLRKGW